MKKAILLFGPTGAGKTTLGNLIAESQPIKYFSFGDLKRIEIAQSSLLGQRLESRIRNGQPIFPHDGVELLSHYINEGLNIICGFPISPEEFESFSSLCSVIGVVSFVLTPEIAEKRFFSRRICPVCARPGQEGDICPVHKQVLTVRSDMSVLEYKARFLLYQERIVPFLASECLQHLPHLHLNSENLSPDEQCKCLIEWIIHHLHGDV